ncbi:MAG TPA: DUF3667 domain-containing protein [Thermoanaerobaculia bacterium]
MAQPPGRCLNCGAPLAGAFCHRCGQEAVDRRVPLRTLAADALGDLFALDSRVLRTLRPLFLRPGFLSAEWCRGRRVPYVPPLRLYIFVAAVFFFVLAVTDRSGLEFQTKVAEDPPAAGQEEPAAPPAAPPAATDEGRLHWLAEAMEGDPEAFEARYLDRFGSLSLLLPPVLAVLLALLYRRRRRLFVEHLVFSLHFHAFAFLVGGAAAFLPERVWARGLNLAMLAVFLAYLAVALTRVYGGRWWITAGRMAFLVFGYLVFAVLPVALLALLWAGASS